MEKDIKSSQRGKNYVKGSLTTSEGQTPEEKVVFYEKGAVAIVSNEDNNLQNLFNTIKATLHGESDKITLCEWQLPPNSKKASCVPINCIDSGIE